jgi:hypothetical protein
MYSTVVLLILLLGLFVSFVLIPLRVPLRSLSRAPSLLFTLRVLTLSPEGVGLAARRPRTHIGLRGPLSMRTLYPYQPSGSTGVRLLSPRLAARSVLVLVDLFVLAAPGA